MIPLVDLKAQYRGIAEEVQAAITPVLERGQFVLGPTVEAFERDFAAYCGVPHAVGVNSGTSALHLALRAVGIGPGDEIITVPFTFVATVAAIEHAGARPVFVDIEPGYCTMDPAAIGAAVTARTKAVIPVHLYGQPADMDPILEVARQRDLIVIEDAAQAHGAEYKGRRVGSMGDLGCFSFYPGKNLGAAGEGGAVVTANPEYADTLRLLRAWGERVPYEHSIRAFNARMDGIQGAVLGVKLRHLEDWTEARRARAAAYRRALVGTGAKPLPERPDVRHVYHLFVVRLPQRDAWRAHLFDRQVQSGVHYPAPVHLQPAYRDLGYGPGSFPVSETVAGDVLSLPVFPELTDVQIDTIAAIVRDGLSAGAGAHA